MDEFWKAVAAILVTLILGVTIEKTEKDLSVLLTLFTSCMAVLIGLSYLRPVLELIKELASIGNMQDGFLGILLKAVGIAIISELAGMICNDAGNNSLSKTLQLLSSTAILYLSIPIFRSLFTLIYEILGGL